MLLQVSAHFLASTAFFIPVTKTHLVLSCDPFFVTPWQRGLIQLSFKWFKWTQGHLPEIHSGFLNMYLQKAFECFQGGPERQVNPSMSRKMRANTPSPPGFLSQECLNLSMKPNILWKTWLRQRREEGDQATGWDTSGEDWCRCWIISICCVWMICSNSWF